MLDSVAYESYPTHPLGARDSWPATGPVYGIPPRVMETSAPKTVWQRLVANVYDTPDVIPESTAEKPGTLPIWY